MVCCSMLLPNQIGITFKHCVLYMLQMQCLSVSSNHLSRSHWDMNESNPLLGRSVENCAGAATVPVLHAAFIRGLCVQVTVYFMQWEYMYKSKLASKRKKTHLNWPSIPVHVGYLFYCWTSRMYGRKELLCGTTKIVPFCCVYRNTVNDHAAFFCLTTMLVNSRSLRCLKHGFHMSTFMHV